jgi:hypothetical protein
MVTREEQSEARKRQLISPSPKKKAKVAPLSRDLAKRSLKPSQKANRSWYLVVPEGSFRRTWDLISMGLLVYTIFVTPFQISFDIEESVGSGVWVINRLVDLGFASDLVLNFFTVFIDPETKLPVTSLHRIALQYLKGWFWIDFISVLPLDSIATEMVSDGVSVGNNGRFLRSVKLVRVVRLVRLVKLLRVLRIARVVKRMQHRLGIRFGVIKILKFFFFVVLCVHWNACVWFMVASMVGDTADACVYCPPGTELCPEDLEALYNSTQTELHSGYTPTETWITVYFAKDYHECQV